MDRASPNLEFLISINENFSAGLSEHAGVPAQD
jgi:hypothetical protein